MTKKDTMCEQCTPPKRIVGANPEVIFDLLTFSERYWITPKIDFRTFIANQLFFDGGTARGMFVKF